jgi:signal transduction histidine kinase
MFSTESNLNLRQGSSHRQTKIFLFAGFGGLLLLMAILGLSAISSMYQIELREERIRQDYVVRDRALENLRSNIYVAGTSIRDFLLAGSDNLAEVHRAQFLDRRSQIQAELEDYQKLVSAESKEPFDQLREELLSWFTALTPSLEWDQSQRRSQSYAFMQDQVLSRRTVLLGLTDRIQQLAERDLELSSAAVGEMVASIRIRLVTLMISTLIIGVSLTCVALWRLLSLENESQLRFQEVLRARGELKRLSAEVLSAQETERRRISRELHDEVGQVLSATTLKVGCARAALKDGDREEAFRQLQQLQEMTQRNVGAVRNIALLLRPTMLDDLGLVPALKWLAREVSRTAPTTVDVVAESFRDDLPDEHRTCVFRVVQEAVRNAARHSGARLVRIYLQQETSLIRASVQDDGKGFEPAQEKGLGIMGMEERVVHLGGRLRVESELGRGTIVSFDLPFPNEMSQSETRAETTPQAQISPLRTA